MLIKELRERLKALLEQRAAVTAKAVDEKRGLTDEDKTLRSSITDQIDTLEVRLAELDEAEVREAVAAQARVDAGEAGTEARASSGTTVTDPPVYVSSGLNGQSYFRDLASLALNRENRRDATDRLTRNSRMVGSEQRALGNTNATGGSGGEFAPPTWLVSEYIKLARAGRVTADLLKKGDVPANTSSINLPKVLTGTTVAIQSTQNTALSQTDLTTGAVGTGFTTIGGKEVVSQQMIDQAALPFDQVILGDLAAAYASQVGQQIYLGAGTGANNNSVINGLTNAATIAANQATLAASPTAVTFYSKAAGLLSSFVTNRFQQPTHWLMHPRRWYWLLSLTDSQNRPLVVPVSVAYNPIASDSADTTVQGMAGMFLGLPVIIDPNIPTNLGAGTNQDEVFLIKADDMWLFESPVQVESFRETYSDSVGVLFRLYAYAGTILNRYNTSIATMNGLGLTPPSF